MDEGAIAEYSLVQRQDREVGKSQGNGRGQHGFLMAAAAFGPGAANYSPSIQKHMPMG
jgi:hypothetical protein